LKPPRAIRPTNSRTSKRKGHAEEQKASSLSKQQFFILSISSFTKKFSRNPKYTTPASGPYFVGKTLIFP
jgi:hypothetical protein